MKKANGKKMTELQEEILKRYYSTRSERHVFLFKKKHNKEKLSHLELFELENYEKGGYDYEVELVLKKINGKLSVEEESIYNSYINRISSEGGSKEVEKNNEK